MTTPTDGLERLRALADAGDLDAACRDHGILLLVVFGSAVAPREDRPPEDLDVAVLLEPEADLLEVAGALTDLGGVDVDLLHLNRADVVARAQALTHCVPLYEHRPGLFAERQMAALTERMETAWLRRLDLELMAR